MTANLYSKQGNKKLPFNTLTDERSVDYLCGHPTRGLLVLLDLLRVLYSYK